MTQKQRKEDFHEEREMLLSRHVPKVIISERSTAAASATPEPSCQRQATISNAQSGLLLRAPIDRLSAEDTYLQPHKPIRKDIGSVER